MEKKGKKQKKEKKANESLEELIKVPLFISFCK